MVEIVGDYWEHAFGGTYDALVCTTNMEVKNNGRLVMGAGIAKQFRDHFHDLDHIWGQRIKEGRSLNGVMVTRPDVFGFGAIGSLVACPTKIDWRKPSPLDLIVSSSLSLYYVSQMLGWKKVLMTKLGCSNGGQDWSKIKKRIEFLDDRFYVIDKE